MTTEEYKKLWDGALVKYGFYSNIMFAGETKDGNHVLMRDKSGNEKKVYKSLFLQNAVPITRTC